MSPSIVEINLRLSEMKGTFPIDKFQEIQTPFYYYDTNVLRQTLKTINEEAGKHEGFEVHYAVKANCHLLAHYESFSETKKITLQNRIVLQEICRKHLTKVKY